MDFLSKQWQQIYSQLHRLNLTQRWLIMSLAVILALILFLVALYTGEQDMAPITQFAGERQGTIVTQLQAAGITVKTQGNQILVPRSRLIDALVILEERDLMAADISAAFDELERNRSPWDSNGARNQAYLIAKQKVLGNVVSRMRGVKEAAVVISLPQHTGFGATAQRPTAAVTVWMQGGKQVDKRLVEAIAGLVSGAVAEMHAGDVDITDANLGRHFTVADENEVLPSETFELVEHVRQRFRGEIERTLSYIPGVIVAVNVKVDSVRQTRLTRIGYEKNEPLRSERTREETHSERGFAGEPGAEPNVTMDIAGGGGAGMASTVSETETAFGDKRLTERADSVEIGHRPQEINVTVNVPRSYFVQLWQQSQPAEAPPPDDAALQPIIDRQLAQIQEQIRPLIRSESDGSVAAYMIPDSTAMFAAAGGAATGGVEALLTSQWVKPAGLGLLAVSSLGIMFYMVRKSTQQPDLPSIEELAGVPPTLPSEEDLIGEADEVDPTMAGVELDDEELAVRRIADQISEMVKSSPTEAAQIFTKWVGSGD